MTKTNRYGWVKQDELCYTQSIYYKVNNSIYLRPNGDIVLRNTYTGQEKILKSGIGSKREASKFIQNYMKNNPVY